jgi:Domain of unknown function (DUF4150)
MPHHVYANDNEICSKSADGTSDMAVDVCFSPGAPPPGTPVTYMNTCKAGDVTNGSKSVFIKSMEICLEDKSYFSTSYGDEPATQGLKRGITSTAVQGKCRFVEWSPNVFVEGLAVTRHLDLVTHNHNSPANTPPTPYISQQLALGHCKKDLKRIQDKCKPDDDKTKKRKGIPKGKDTSKASSWVTDHCGPLLVKPGDNFTEWLDDFKDISGLMNEAASQLKDKVITELEQQVLKMAGEKLGKMAVRRGLTGWIPVVGWVMTAVDVVSTGYEIATKTAEIKDTIDDLKKTVDDLKNSAGKITNTFSKYEDKLKNYGNLKPEEQSKVAREVMADVQGAYGAAQPCMKARKCGLVPYKDTDSQADTWAGKGCCPGQTGHHLMPDAMFRSIDPASKAKAFNDWKNGYSGKKDKSTLTPSDMPRDKKAKKDCWDGYTEGGAPTICLEGSDNTSGSHGAVHGLTGGLMKRHQASSEMKYTIARDEMAVMIKGLYGCDADCLKAQLDEYFCKAYSCGKPGETCDQKLNNAKVVPHSGESNGGPKEGGTM